MLRRLATALLCCGVLLFAPKAGATTPTPFGPWLTEDRQGLIAITPCGADICGRIAGITLDHPADPQPQDWRGHPQCGDLIMVAAPTADAAKWSGTITDPLNGAVWQATVTLQNNQLQLRGYLLLPLLGDTQTWVRYTGQIHPGCRFT